MLPPRIGMLVVFDTLDALGVDWDRLDSPELLTFYAETPPTGRASGESRARPSAAAIRACVVGLDDRPSPPIKYVVSSVFTDILSSAICSPTGPENPIDLRRLCSITMLFRDESWPSILSGTLAMKCAGLLIS